MSAQRVGPRFVRMAAVLALAVLVVSCDHDGLPTSPRSGDAPVDTASRRAQPLGPSGLFTALVKQVDEKSHRLMSSEAELEAGRYRYALGTDAPVAIARDEYLYSTIEGVPFVRLVLSSAVDNGELVLETGPARWSDVLQGGTFGIRMPIDAHAPATLTSGAVLPSLREGGTPGADPSAALRIGPLGETSPPLTRHFEETDICLWINDLADGLGVAKRVCDGKPSEVEFGTGVTVKLAGTLDSLKLLDGQVTVSGDMELDMTVDVGGISGGTPPTFSPCNRGAYLGCLTTPTGAAFIEWLRSYAPGVPELSLRPVRVCVPGLPVRIRAGYWDYSGFVPIWRLPVFEQCRIASNGVLPTVIFPSITNSTAIIRPHVRGDMTLRFVGDGELGVKVAIPGFGYSAVYSGGSGIKAKGELGLFVEFKIKAKNTGVSTKYEFDRIVEVIQEWGPTGGWSADREVIRSERALSFFNFTNPDSIVARLGVVASAGIELCFAFTVCEVSGSDIEDQDEAKLKIVGKAGADLSAFGEMTWSREQVHPTDPAITNWHLSTDYAYDLALKAGLEIPLTGWILPQVPRKWEETFECCRLRVNDMWGAGRLNVSTLTTGVGIDPDGYQVQVSRVDTLPRVIDAGATRVGKARDHGKPMQSDVPSTGVVTFGGGIDALPCAVWYSDAALLLDPNAVLIVGGLRAAGIAVPAYAITAFCDMLIGRYQVQLTGVAENCTVVGGPARNNVWLLQTNQNFGRFDNLTELEFVVECGAAVPLGDLQVTTNAVTAPDFTADYEIFVDDVSRGLIGPAETRTLTGMLHGPRVVRLVGGPSNCTLPATANTAVSEEPVVLAFSIACALPAGALAIDATTTGTTDGLHQLLIDGLPRASVPGNGLGIAAGLGALVPTAVHVAMASENCRPTTPTPFIVALDAARTPLTVPFAIECAAGGVVGFEGIVESSTSLTNPVRLRQASGELLMLTGPARGELAQLGGANVRVRGVRTGTSVSVFGYDIMPADGDRIWTGLVTLRDGEVWLLGAEAVRVLAPPAGITGSPGALMWVSGASGSGSQVTARLYGTLRGAQ